MTKKVIIGVRKETKVTGKTLKALPKDPCTIFLSM
jgi:hypothetical protein